MHCIHINRDQTKLNSKLPRSTFNHHFVRRDHLNNLCGVIDPNAHGFLFWRALQVGNRDTLTSVAARFDTTPGELTSLNKLNSSFIYPGQQLLVPDKNASSIFADNVSDDSASDLQATKGSPTDKSRKMSAGDAEQEEKERGTYSMCLSICCLFVCVQLE